MEYYADGHGIFQSRHMAEPAVWAALCEGTPSLQGSLTTSPVPDNIRDSE
jgi:hypothetical protein